MSQAAIPRTNASRFLLTWSAVTDENVNVQTIITHLLSFSSPTWIEACQEQHEDGTNHYHAVAVYPDRLQRRFTDFSIGDFNADIKPIRHGIDNLQRCRAYLRKERAQEEDENARPLWAEHGDIPPYNDGPSRTLTQAQKRDTWKYCLEADTQDEYLRRVKATNPREFQLHFFQLQAFAQYHYTRPDVYVPKYGPGDFDIPAEMHDWVDEMLGEVRHPLFADNQFYRVG